ncbi:LacI family DNA-binding transcriptional regulator [bacterium]|nr:LacI family DNA-binding transcriptional regulator [bacterium]
MKITIKEIAKELGVSPSTVSRALRNHPAISEGTKKRVRETAERLGYRPNALARGLATRRSKTIGLIVLDISNPFYAEIAEGVEEVVSSNGYSLLLCNSGYDPEKESKYIGVLRERRVEGIIITTLNVALPHIQDLWQNGPPFVPIDWFPGDNPCVTTNNVEGARQAIEYLLSIGHRDIAYLAGPSQLPGAMDRVEGYRRALHKYGIPFREELVIYENSTAKDGYKGFKELLERGVKFTALFCANDMVAIGAMRAAQEMGVRIPDDISLVGYDDIEIASLLSVPLTTVWQPRKEQGIMAANLLMEMLKEKKKPLQKVVLEQKLVIRMSTKPIEGG